MPQIELAYYIPESASYQVYYPKHFLLSEDENGIVTITSPETNSNLTLSSYTANRDVDETILTDFFNRFTKDYTSLSELRKASTKNKIWLERDFKNEKAFWTFWALSHSTKIILVSANSNDVLSPEDRHLYTFMLDKIEIYSDEE